MFTKRIDMARIAEAVIGFLFALAAATKIVAPPGFLLVCRYLFSGVVGQGVITGLAITVVTVELAIGARFLLGNVSRNWLWFTGAVLMAFSVTLVVLVRDPLAPPCACVGITHLVNRANTEAPLGLLRNAALLWILVLLLLNRAGSRRRRNPRRRLESPSPSSN